MKFGLFDLDASSGELRKQGIRIKVTGQPVQVLAFLIERSGELVTREELRNRLWPGDTFVDFDHSLNAAIKRLRRALEDDPENPLFIETVPRYGYRFIGTIDKAPVDLTTTPLASPADPQATPAVGELENPAKRFRWPRLVLLAAIIGILAGAATVPTFWRSPPAVNSLAVLPFSNSSGDENLNYLTDGIAGSIIDEVSHIRSVSVIAWSQASRYRSADPSAAGRTLKVGAVLTGVVARYGDTVVVRVELLDPSTSRHLWGEEYTRSIGDVHSIQGQLTSDVARQLHLQLDPSERQRLATPNTRDAEAYDLYLRGRYYSAKGTRDGLAKGLSYLQEATEKDPGYAQAYSGLAFYYFVAMDWLMSPAEANEKARAAAEKSLSLDDNLPEAHTMLGVVHWIYDHDWNSAEKQFRRAIELNRDYAPAHEFYSLFLASQSRGDEAVSEMRQALALDPLSVELNTMYGQVLARTRQTDSSIDQLKKTVELDPNNWFPRLGLGYSYLQNRQFPEAIAELRRTVLLESNPDVWGALGLAYGLSGQRKEAQRVLQTLELRSRHEYIPPYDFAQVYIGLHDNDHAFEWLEKARQAHGFAAAWFKVATEIDPLRSDPRYDELLRKAGFEPTPVTATR
jgi:TolB-like protein/DNA-binding winged helix-turn-helix (wHTH) protein/Tfp pilus assembly protein PilF